MPTNGENDYLLYSLQSIPIFTYGMISITTLVLAYATMMDQGEAPPPSDLLTSASNSIFGTSENKGESQSSSMFGGKTVVKNHKFKKTRRLHK